MIDNKTSHLRVREFDSPITMPTRAYNNSYAAAWDDPMLRSNDANRYYTPMQKVQQASPDASVTLKDFRRAPQRIQIEPNSMSVKKQRVKRTPLKDDFI